jgi:hypothetical protein
MSWKRYCPYCGAILDTLVEDAYYPSGATGSGTWFFRRYSLFLCNRCAKYFSVRSARIPTIQLNSITDILEDSDS